MSFREPITLDECIPRIAGARAVVTGGAGFIGSHLVDYLLQHGVGQITIVDDLSRARLDWLESRKDHPQIQFIKGDIWNIDFDNPKAAWDFAETALKGVQVVFHLAAISRVMDAERDPERTNIVNHTATAFLGMAAQTQKVRRFVFTSSREVYGDPETLPVHEYSPLKPKNVYGRSKAAAEGEVNYLQFEDDRVEPIILRLANVYGPGDRGRVIPIFLENALKGQPLTLYGGEQTIDFIWVGDVVEVLVKAGFSERHVYRPTNIGSGTQTSLKTLAQRIVDLVGNNVPIHIAPPRGPEVERFQAGLVRASAYFGLEPKADPLDHLHEVLAAMRTEKAQIRKEIRLSCR
jgi:UDP-glucose 4-epimerase